VFLTIHFGVHLGHLGLQIQAYTVTHKNCAKLFLSKLCRIPVKLW